MTIRRVTLGLACAALLVLGATEWLAHPLIIAGPSMEPALLSGDLVLVDVWTYRRRAPRNGEIVVAREPHGRGRVVKRVAPGPSPGGVWLLGDNRAGSEDSRAWGAVENESVEGRVVWRYWPPSRFGRLPASATSPRASSPR